MSANVNRGVPCADEQYLTKIQQFARDIDRLATLARAKQQTERQEMISIIEALIQQLARHVQHNKSLKHTPQRHKEPSLTM